MALEEVPKLAAFTASEKASGIPRTTVNLTLGGVADQRGRAITAAVAARADRWLAPRPAVNARVLEDTNVAGAGYDYRRRSQQSDPHC
jgi:hypothetical protein